MILPLAEAKVALHNAVTRGATVPQGNAQCIMVDISQYVSNQCDYTLKLDHIRNF